MDTGSVFIGPSSFRPRYPLPWPPISAAQKMAPRCPVKENQCRGRAMNFEPPVFPRFSTSEILPMHLMPCLHLFFSYSQCFICKENKKCGTYKWYNWCKNKIQEQNKTKQKILLLVLTYNLRYYKPLIYNGLMQPVGRVKAFRLLGGDPSLQAIPVNCW